MGCGGAGGVRRPVRGGRGEVRDSVGDVLGQVRRDAAVPAGRAAGSGRGAAAHREPAAGAGLGHGPLLRRQEGHPLVAQPYRRKGSVSRYVFSVLPWN